MPILAPGKKPSLLLIVIAVVGCTSLSRLPNIRENRVTGETVRTGATESAAELRLTREKRAALVAAAAFAPQLADAKDGSRVYRIRVEFQREMPTESYLRIKSGPSLVLILDGEKMTLASTLGGEAFEQREGITKPLWYERAIYAPLTREQMLRIAGAKKAEFELEGELDTISGELSLMNLRSFRAFLDDPLLAIVR